MAALIDRTCVRRTFGGQQKVTVKNNHNSRVEAILDELKGLLLLEHHGEVFVAHRAG